MNTIENPAVIEQTTKAPTALRLFSYKGPELAALKTKASTVRALGENLTKTDASLNKLTAETDIRGARLGQSARELFKQLENTNSSVNCGLVFVKMRKELSELSSEDFMVFFKQCLAENTRLDEEVRKSTAKAGEKNMDYQTITLLRNPLAAFGFKSVFEEIKSPPKWFHGNKSEWDMFTYAHGNFLLYLNPHLLESRIINRPGILKTLRDSSKLESYTINGEFPDWLLEDSDIMPDVKEVEEELTEDKAQVQKINEAIDKIKKQGSYLADMVNQKVQKATSRLSDLLTQVFLETPNFSDVILFLGLAGKKLNSIPINDEAAETVMQRYVHSRTLLTDHEPLALYLEKRLREGGLIKTSQDQIDTNFINLVTSALRNAKAQKDTGEQENSFQNLKTTDKKAYGALNYDIRPFLEVLPSDELSLLEDLLKESKDKPVELFIWDIAKSISSAFNNKKREDLTKSQIGAIFYLGKFTTSFLKDHAAWAYQQIQQVLTPDSQHPELEQSDSNQDELQREIQMTTQEIVQGNLAGWQFFYTTNRTSEPRHLIEVEGQTTEDFERNLHRFITDRKISCSIPAGSIVNAFEWLVTEVPKETEQTRMGMQINGEYFKKLKRERVRIIYQMSSSDKKIIFFIHQKQDWSYGF